MASLTIELPDDLVQKAKQCGVLDKEDLAKILRQYLQQQIEHDLALPYKNQPISIWLQQHPLPTDLQQSTQSIDLAIIENRQAWD